MYTSDAFLNIVSWQLSLPTNTLHPSLHLRDDLLLDAVDRLLLFAELETCFDSYLNTDQVSRIETIGDLQRTFATQAGRIAA